MNAFTSKQFTFIFFSPSVSSVIVGVQATTINSVPFSFLGRLVPLPAACPVLNVKFTYVYQIHKDFFQSVIGKISVVIFIESKM